MNPNKEGMPTSKIRSWAKHKKNNHQLKKQRHGSKNAMRQKLAKVRIMNGGEELW